MKNTKKLKYGFSLIELSIVILVIGILVIGITKGSRIIKNSRLSSAKSLTTSSPVASISGLSLWLETTSQKSFDDADKVDGNGVGNWYDINPTTLNPINVSQATSNDRPSYLENGINNLPTLKFDGANDSLSKDNILGASLTGANLISVFLVEKKYQPALSIAFTWWYGGVACNRFAVLAYPSTVYFQAFGCGVTNSSLVSSTINLTGQAKIISGIRAYNSMQLRVNGQLVSSRSDSTNTPDIAQTGLLEIGAQSSSSWFDGEIGEIIIFNRALSNIERDSVEQYLSTKWGIKLN